MWPPIYVVPRGSNIHFSFFQIMVTFVISYMSNACHMVQPLAELDTAGVGLSFANWMAVISP